MTPQLDILYEDNHLLGVYKPGGLLVQGDRTGDATALAMAKAYIRTAYNKPGNVFLGLVHRIDRPVSGVLLLARTSKAASRLATTFQTRRVEKAYLAVVIGAVPDDAGELIHYIERDGATSRVVREPSKNAKESVLHYRVMVRRAATSLLEVALHTGRHHQIRVQLAAEGHPVVGDLRYGADSPLPDRTIGLHAARLALDHPVKDTRVVLAALPPVDNPPWIDYRSEILRWFE